MRSLLLGVLILSTIPTYADEYEIDGVHSTVVFRIRHLEMAYFYGLFRTVQGKVRWSEDLTSNSIEVQIDAASVFTNNKQRDDHLRNSDFLHVERYPQLTFVSSKIERQGERIVVTGTLAAHGVNQQVSFPIEITGSGKDPWGKQRIGAHATLMIKRSDFGMNNMLDKLGDEVQLLISLEATLP
jgi:polyisoprenoid-binding protein YceI